MSPTVVFNGRFLTQVHTGVQRYAVQTLLALDRLLGAGEGPAAAASAAIPGANWVLAVPDGAAPLPLQHIRRVHLPGGSGHVWEQTRLAWFARQAYLVNLNYSGPLLKRRQLITVHDATVKAQPASFTRAYRLVHNTLVSVLGRRAETVMTVSAFSRSELQRWFGLPGEDIVVGREGGEHALRPAGDPDAETAWLAQHGLHSGRFVLGVGSIKPNKNFALLGQAMALLPDFDWPVAVAGAKDIGIFGHHAVQADGFRFLGFVDDERLSLLYRHAACFVLPSLYEGFGLPAVEAMAHDCPVLAARAASLPEVCGDAALYFDPQDPASLAQALRELAGDSALRQRLVRSGRQRLAHHNWAANAQILLAQLPKSGDPAVSGAQKVAPKTSSQQRSGQA